MKELLQKLFNTPGLCSIEELEICNDFLSELKERLDTYVDAVGYEPLGKTLEVNLAKVQWYVDRDKQLKNAEY